MVALSPHLIDKLIIEFDHCLKALSSEQPPHRPYPAQNLADSPLPESARKQSAGFMRINHSGEVCAQALYNGQALVAQDAQLRHTLHQCAAEEADHLAWCTQRLQELDSHRSVLNIFWYWNSFLIGIAAGLAGDQWSLGFVEETEIQVGKHLQGHLEKLTDDDVKSKAVIAQMKHDEAKHAATARHFGAKPLPTLIKKMMAAHAKLMTTLAYWL